MQELLYKAICYFLCLQMYITTFHFFTNFCCKDLLLFSTGSIRLTGKRSTILAQRNAKTITLFIRTT